MAEPDSGKGFHLPVLAIVGVGMIGGSLSLGLKKRRLVGRVIGFGRNRENLDRAMEIGAIDEIASSPADAARDADMVVLATPVGVMGAIMRSIVSVLREDAVITDVGSVKQGVADAAREALGHRLGRFVPGHPVAGREHSGVAAATADLYEHHRVALTPLAESDADAVERVEEMWRRVGADIVRMEVAEHDRVLAMTSHLPHLLAYAMVHYFAADDDREKCYEMVAGGFYDFTRIASSDPVMWRDICGMNREFILDRIQGYRKKLETLESLVSDGNDLELEALFSAAREARAVVTERRRIAPTQEQISGRRRVRQQVNR
jgi:prephenate dehydrogenase